MNNPTRCPSCLSSEVVKLADGLFTCRACGGFVPSSKPNGLPVRPARAAAGGRQTGGRQAQTGRMVVSTNVWTVAAVYQFVGEQTINRWVTLGQTDSDIHWAYGLEAKDLIDKGIPAMVVYLAIGRKAGKSSQTIRKSFYTYKTFSDAQREQYHAAPYSVFAHARTCDDPEAVLQYYADEQNCTVDEIEAVFRQGEDIDFKNDFKRSQFPRYLVGAYRRLMGLPAPKREQAEGLLRRFIEVVK